jgi:murein DD-endopeptidase MepM/ murein hydrolase activator NlpD
MKHNLNAFSSAKHLNFLIYPDQGKGISFRLSRIIVYTLALVLGILIAIFFVFVTYLGEISYKAYLSESLIQENQKLREYNARVTQLEKELNEYRKLTFRIAQLAGIDSSSFSFSTSKTGGAVLFEDSLIQTGKAETALIADTQSWAKDDDVPYGLPLDGWISKGFIDDPKSLSGAHPGIDIAAPEGKEVKATAKGLVKFSGWDDHYGNLIIIDHENGYETYYGHNSKLSVSKGQMIRRGQVIALSGNTGRSSAPHLHYEIKRGGVSVNPENYIGQKDEK